ncbi:MAG: bifunctional serine/threonine-protein kinase/formylglycine-generating enzyme family protein [Planctomycetota bacterium]
MPSSSSPPPSDQDALFDQWLDRALAGDVEPPAAFCGRHGAGPALRAALERICEQLGGDARANDGTQGDGRLLPADDGLPCEMLGEFRLLKQLGEGGMGTVFLAEQPSLQRLVALKVVRGDLLGSPTARQRFELEARAVARLRHPHIVTLFSSGEQHGVRFLVMELVPGRSLDEVLATDQVRVDRAVRWCHEIATALQIAHGEGIVHRDVKPSNIRIDPQHRAVLLDFGLARDLLEHGPPRTIEFAGSPQYASPEQRRGERDAVDHRSDIYSLGVVLYEALTGCLPYEGTTLESIAAEASHREPPAVRQRNPGIARDLALVVEKAMEASPDDRYATMQAFAGDLLAVLELRPVAASPPSRGRRLSRWCRRNRGTVLTAAAMAAALVLVVVLQWIEQRRDQQHRRQQAANLLQEARDEINAYRERRAAFSIAADRAYQLEKARLERFLSEDELAFLQRHSINREVHWGSTDALFAVLAQKVHLAEELDPDSREGDEVWARFWFERWTDHRTSLDWRALFAFCRQQAELHDHDGDERRRMRGAVEISIVSDPPGAEVHMFRSVEAADLGRDEPLQPVQALAGDRRMIRIPWPDETSLLGKAPIARLPIERGEYIIELRMPEHETVTLPVVVPYREPERALHREYGGRMLPLGTTPAGFVRVSDARGRWPGVFMQEREVTNGEYLTFLNSSSRDPEERLAQPPRPLGRTPWTEREHGSHELPATTEHDHPVVGVSWHDAARYARWWNRNHELRILDVSYEARLPTRKEWRRAAGAVNTPSFRRYPFGNYFSPHWCKGRFARPTATLEPIRSYPFDVSLYGALDMAGSAAEWCNDFLDEGQTLRPLAGGSWQDSHPDAFAIDAVRALDAGAAGLHTGFRLVWAPRE